MKDSPSAVHPQFSDLMGKIVSFYPNAELLGQFGIPKEPTPKVCGEIVGLRPSAPLGPGLIPECLIKVRGRSGRTLEVGYMFSYAKVHPNWQEAVADCDLP